MKNRLKAKVLRRKIQSVISISLVFALMFSCFIGIDIVRAVETEEIWDGTTAKPVDKGNGVYEISTPEQLAYVISTGGGEGNTYNLTADIYLNDTQKVNWATGEVATGYNVKSWYTKGKWEPFNGNINGNGHTVYGLYYKDTDGNQPSDNWPMGAGLVPYMGKGAIKNIGVDYSYIYNYDMFSTAAIVGGGHSTIDATIEQCYAGQNVAVKGYDVGGIAGGGHAPGRVKITNCYSLATLEGKNCVGGIIGSSWQNDIWSAENCFTINKATGSTWQSAAFTNVYETVDGAGAELITNIEDIKGRAAKTTLQGFNFNMVWMTSNGYPELRVFNGAVPEDESMFYKTENWRPQFHYTPEKGWGNDPNGLIYYKGEYHLFYQHNPSAVGAWNIHWGHAVSKDLIHWEELDLALFPDENGTCWSGSCIIDETNKSGLFKDSTGGMMAFYTCWADNKPQQQCLAYSEDCGRTWKKYEGNPIIPTSEDPLENGDFRDPYVFWHEEANKYMMIVAGGPLRIYSSTNLIDWTFESGYDSAHTQYRPQGAPSIHSECPALFKMNVDGVEGKEKWVYSASGRWYMIGDFKQVNGKWAFIPDSSSQYSMTVGVDKYAFQTFNNVQDGRVLGLYWMNDWGYAQDISNITKTFNGTYSMVYEMSLKTTSDGIRLFMEPAKEYVDLRKETLANLKKVTVTEKGENVLKDVRSDQFEIVANIKPSSKVKEVGFKLRKGVTEETVVKYDVATSSLVLDRSNSSSVIPNDSFLVNGISSYKINKKSDGSIDLHIFVDATTIEVTANGGEINGAMQIFPSYASIGMQAYSVGGDTVADIEVYELKSIWREKEYTSETPSDIYIDIANGAVIQVGDTVTVNSRVTPTGANKKVDWSFENAEYTIEIIEKTDTSVTFKVKNIGDFKIIATVPNTDISTFANVLVGNDKKVFNTNLSGWQSFGSSKWELTNEGYKGITSGDAFLLADAKISNNFKLKFDVVLKSGSAFGVVFNSTDNPANGSYIINADMNTGYKNTYRWFEFPYREDSISTIISVGFKDSLVFEYNKRYEVEVLCQASKITFSINGNIIFKDTVDKNQTEIFNSGRIGFMGYNSTFVVNNFYVYEGDINSDGIMDIRDIVRMKKEISKGNYFTNIDIDRDGKADSVDLITLRKLLLEI